MMVSNWYLLFYYFIIFTNSNSADYISHIEHCFFNPTNMKLFPLLLTLLPIVSANRVHKLQLHKIPSVAANAELESAYLAEKYGAPQSGQLPLLGSGGSGRRMQRPTMRNGEQLLWTQENINGGHPVTLTSKPFCFSSPIHHISAT